MEVLHTFEKDGNTIEIVQDYNSESPREWCNLGTFYGKHRRYISPDNITEEETRAAISAGAIVLPVWMYDHGGTAYQASEANPFHCPWDSGQFGVIYVTREKVRKEFGVKRISPKLKARVLGVLKAEVSEYGAWANGEVYGFRVMDKDGEELDSCYGFIGMENTIESAKDAL